MSRVPLLAALCLLLAAATPGAAQGTTVQTQPMMQTASKSFRFAGDGLTRYEWTRDVPGEDEADSDRWRVQLRPRVDLTVGPLEAAVGGEFNYSKDHNDETADGSTPDPLRDNYRSRDARLDLAYGRLKLGPVTGQGGRFAMPLPLTEMTWDRDLRATGGAVSVTLGGSAASTSRIAATGIYSKGSHVFEDESVLYGGSAELLLTTGTASSLQLAGSYLQFDDLHRLGPPLRRENTRADGRLAYDYHVVDVVGRLSAGGEMPYTLVADYCWNTTLSTNNRGVWLSLALGEIGVSRVRAEYTYARVDRDATLAAFSGDDFFWGTGWEGHRADLGFGSAPKSSMHAIASWARLKDSPDATVASQYVKRWRLEWRTSF